MPSIKPEENMHYGKDCPKGMVQIEFVGCSPKEKRNDYGWKPTESAFLEVYVDGHRYRINVGTFHDGNAERRGLHIIGPMDMQIEKTSVNACSVWIESEPAPKQPSKPTPPPSRLIRESEDKRRKKPT